MVKLAHNEQYIALYPLTSHYSIGPFPTRAFFRPSKGPFIIGLISGLRLLTVRSGLFCVWAKFSPSLQSARLWTVNMLGRFHVKKTRWAVYIELPNTAY